jgi:F-type H+-transporting ATPase subunit b
MTWSILFLLVQHEAAAEGGLPAPFRLNPGLIIWTWIVFGALYFLLKKYAWPPIVRLTEEREKRIAHQLAEAERLRAESQAAVAEQQRLLQAAKDDAQKLLQEAKVLAQKEREHVLQRAQQEQQQVLERAKREIESERERAVDALRREAVELSLAAAARLIRQRMDAESDRRLVEEFIDSVGTGGS